MTGKAMSARVIVMVATVVFSTVTRAGETSRFLMEYPAAAVELEKATTNVTCKGTLRTKDYEGPVRFSKLGGDGVWSMKQFDATQSTLPWKRRVESFSKDWFFMLDGKSNSAPFEFKGVDFLESLPRKDALQVTFRRWLRCDKFTCGLYNVYGSSVTELIARQDFAIVSEWPTEENGLYEVRFMVKSILKVADDNFLQGRMLFDERFAWALVGFDVMYEMPGVPGVDYIMARSEPRRWADGKVLPARVEIWGGAPVAGKATKLGSPEWSGNASHEIALFEEVTLGELKEKDFLPSAFGLPDHLVLGTVSVNGSSAWSWWLVVIVANGALLLWWGARRLKARV